MIRVVDMYPTIAALAGASTPKTKRLDGLNMWPTLSEGKTSPRTGVIYNVEPFRAGVREGDWKLIWRSPLPSAIELYNIPQDPLRKTTSQPRILKSLPNFRNAQTSWLQSWSNRCFWRQKSR